MIKNFEDKETKLLFEDIFVKRFAGFERAARRKLQMLNAANSLQDLLCPPGNCLEALKGDRKGRFIIRINDQWRLCFGWVDNNATQAEIVDYH